MSPKRTKTKSSPSKRPEPEAMEEVPTVKKLKVYELKLTAEELSHFRDLMSVMLPPDGATTLSQSLAVSNKNPMLEAKLWSKLIDACRLAGIPTDEEAPDYVVGIVGMPTLGVYPIQLHEDTEEPT